MLIAQAVVENLILIATDGIMACYDARIWGQRAKNRLELAIVADPLLRLGTLRH